MNITFKLNSENNRTFHFVVLAIFLCLEVVLHYLEIFISIPIGGYSLKVGISNIIVLSALYLFGELDSFFLTVAKIPLAMLLEPQFNLMTLLISLSGSLLSFAFMVIFKNIFKAEIIITSCVGGVFHNFGQLIAVIIITKLSVLIWYLPFLIVMGIITGYLVGNLSNFLLNKLNLIKHK